MLLRLQNSVASMHALMREQERVAHNLANVNTTGYKRDRTFTEAFNEHLDVENAPRSERIATQWADHKQGVLEKTGNPLDVAIDGEGFFVFTNDDTGAMRYARGGRLTLDAEGTLRDQTGWSIEGNDGPVQIPATAVVIEVGRNGEINVDGQVVGVLRVVTFDDPTQLRRADGAAFDAGALEPEPVENPMVLQGYVEASNVDAVREMIDMITVYRQFESHQKMLQTTDQVLGAITRSLGKF